MVDLLLMLLACVPEPAKPPPSDSGAADTGAADTGPADTDSGTTDTGGGDTGDTDTIDTGADTGDTGTSLGTVELWVETDAEEKIVGETPRGGRGYDDPFAAKAAGDVDGDGVEDVIAGCSGCGDEYSGRAYLLQGPFAGRLPVGDAAATFTQAESSGLGLAVGSAGDVDGDGFGDLLVAQGECRTSWLTDNCVFLVRGPVSGMLDVATVAHVTFVGEFVTYPGVEERLPGSGTGEEMGVGDFDGDGFTDMFTSAPRWSGVGAAYVVSGPFASEVMLGTDATFRFENDDADGVGGVANLGDVNGDGLDDLAVGQSDDLACVSVFHGPLSGAAYRADADATFHSPGEPVVAASRGKLAGAGDVNADGYADALVVSPALRRGGVTVGGAYVVAAPFASEVDLADSMAILEDGGYITPVADGPGDLDGDGRADIVFGAGYFDGLGTSRGETFVVLAPLAGTMSLLDAAYIVHGTETAAAGAMLDHADFDGDGLPDLLITGPEDTEGGGYAGAAWIVGGFGAR